ncbi:MAG: hypothetical protein ABWW70_02230 [Thermoproteota archaeon]
MGVDAAAQLEYLTGVSGDVANSDRGSKKHSAKGLAVMESKGKD